MSAAFKENWKRLSDKLNGHNTGDDEDIVRFQDQALLTTNASGIAGAPIQGTPTANGEILKYTGTTWQHVPSILEPTQSGVSFIQANASNNPGPHYHSQIFGIENTISSASVYHLGSYYLNTSNFIAGSGNTLGNPYWISRGSFAQGQNNYLGGYGGLIQGVNNTMGNGYGVLVQGIRNNWTQGYMSFCQGVNNTIVGNSPYGFVQGYLHSINTSSKFFCQGARHVLSSGSASVFVQGDRNNIDGIDSSVQGRLNTVTADRCFIQGVSADAIRDDQKVWGSNVVGAQKSRIVKGLTTIDATPANILTLNLEEDKSYAIRALLVARNTTTDAETATFLLARATAYRDTAGAAVLVSSPIALTNENSGGGAAAWSARLLSSSNDILLEVTGDASDTIKWNVDFEFVEVIG